MEDDNKMLIGAGGATREGSSMITDNAAAVATHATTPAEDRVIWRRDLMAMFGVTSSETIRIWMRNGKLPEPDVNLSQRTKGWRLSTLRNAGLGLV